MTEQRKKLIERFQKWLDTNPRKQIIAAECANIAEQYHKEQLMLANVVEQSEQLVCDKHHWMYRGERLDGRFVCERCGEVK